MSSIAAPTASCRPGKAVWTMPRSMPWPPMSICWAAVKRKLRPTVPRGARSHRLQAGDTLERRHERTTKTRHGGAWHPAIQGRGCQRCGHARTLQEARADLPQTGARQVPVPEMAGHGRDPGHLLSRALPALGPRSRCAGPGGPGRFRGPPFLFLLHRDLATGSLLHHGPAHPGGPGPVSRHGAVRPGLVRLCLPADGVDRPLHLGRASVRGGPQCPHAPGQGEMVLQQGLAQTRQAHGLAPDRPGDGRGVDPLLPRCL